MTTKNLTVMVTASNAPLARALAGMLSPGGVGMFEAERQLNGVPAYFVSSGHIDAAFTVYLPMEGSDQDTKDAARDVLFAAVQGAATIQQCQSLVDTTIVVDCDLESAEATYQRFGLTLPPESI